MRKLFEKIGLWIRGLIDFFYPPFRKYFSPELFRYAACGGGNMLFDTVLYYLIYNYVIQHRIIHFGCIALSPHIATLAVVFPITTLSGFLLQKYVTFTASYLRGTTQLFRYFLVVLLNLAVNYFGLKLLVDVLGIYPTPSKIIITCITILLSYIFSKIFTFRIKKNQ